MKDDKTIFWEKWKNYQSMSKTKSDSAYFLTLFPPNYFDYFIDIGAQQGWVAHEVAERNPLTTILSLEPVISEYQVLIDFAAKRFSNIRTFNLALGNGQPLYWKKISSGFHLFVEEDSGRYKIQSKPLVDIFSENNIDPNNKKVFLKIDCEGGERFLLNDEKSIEIMKQCLHITMEIHFTSPCAKNKRFNYYKFPDWSIYNNWINDNFQNSHQILYHKSRKGLGLGTYVLTRKDIV